MESLRSGLKKFVYRKETHYKLNYLTLATRDPKLRADIRAWKGEHLNKVLVPFCLVVLLSVAARIHSYLSATDAHPVNLIVASVTLVFPVLMKIQLKQKCYSWATYNLYGFFFVYCIAAILICNSWLPAHLYDSKLEFSGAVGGSYLIVMVIPVHTYYVALLLMTPGLLYVTVLEHQLKVALYEEYKLHMSEELAGQFGYAKQSLVSVLFRNLVAVGFITLCQYYSQLQSIKLIIEK